MSRQILSYYTTLVLYKSYADFRAEASRSYLGVVWWVLEPLLNMVVYYVIFGLFLSRGDDDFIPYLLTGLVVWRYFEATAVRTAGSVGANMGMIRKAAIHKLVFPITSMLTCIYEFVFSLIVLFFVLFLYGFYPTVHWLLLPFLLLVLLFFTSGFALPLAAVTPFLPDILKFTRYILRIVFYMSAVMFKLEWLPVKYQQVLWLNPVLSITNAFHETLMYSNYPFWSGIAAVCMLSLAGNLLGYKLLRYFDKTYAKRAIQ